MKDGSARCRDTIGGWACLILTIHAAIRLTVSGWEIGMTRSGSGHLLVFSRDHVLLLLQSTWTPWREHLEIDRPQLGHLA